MAAAAAKSIVLTIDYQREPLRRTETWVLRAPQFLSTFWVSEGGRGGARSSGNDWLPPEASLIV